MKSNTNRSTQIEYFNPDKELEKMYRKYDISVDKVFKRRKIGDIRSISRNVISEYIKSGDRTIVIAPDYSESFFSACSDKTVFISESHLHEIAPENDQITISDKFLVATSFDLKDEAMRYLGEHFSGYRFASLYYLLEKNHIAINSDIMHMVMEKSDYPKELLNRKSVKIGRLWSVIQYNAQYSKIIRALMNELEWLSIKYAKLSRLGKFKYNGVGQELIARGMYKADPITIIRLLNDLEQIKKETDEPSKKYLCKKVVDYFLIMRDFLSAYDYIDKYITSGDLSENYLNLKKEIESLFGRMENVVNKRNDDIVLNWIDDVPYDKLNELPFVQNQLSNGVFIPNTFASLPYTTWVTRSIFSGERAISGKLYLRGKIGSSDKEYPLVKMLKNDGYSLKYAAFRSRATKVYKKSMLTKLDTFDESMLSTRSQWFGVCELCRNRNKLFIILHSLFETHRPFASPLNSLKNVRTWDEKKKSLNRYYIDKEIEWYSRFYGKNSKCIWMSDHGDKHVQGDTGNSRVNLDWYDDYSTHSFIGCTGPNIQQHILNGFFTFDRFADFYKYIQNPSERLIDGITTDEVRYESYDLYFSGGVNSLTKMKYEERMKLRGQWMQFIGLRNELYKYIRFRDNTELFYVLPDEKTNHIEDEKYLQEISKMRKQISDSDFLDIDQIDFFSVSRKLYKKD